MIAGSPCDPVVDSGAESCCAPLPVASGASRQDASPPRTLVVSQASNARRRINVNRIRLLFCYSVHEVAELLGVHRQTVKRWIREGLTVLDNRKPILIPGVALKAFLMERKARKKQPCRVGEMYCLRCRKPRIPEGLRVECDRTTTALGMLRGRCSDCGTVMNRRVATAALHTWREVVELTFRERDPRLLAVPEQGTRHPGRVCIPVSRSAHAVPAAGGIAGRPVRPAGGPHRFLQQPEPRCGGPEAGCRHA
ncbi:MAG: helix-turn-helix domain-containing protein [Pseudomonadales bacterium]|nr:helix-turn-helix domain-containing protein [Pseudomonadales bacterium]